MNVFEDLIEELREENLLEETAVEKNIISNAVENKFNDAFKVKAFRKDAVLGVSCVEPNVIEIDADSIVEYGQQAEHFDSPKTSPEITQKTDARENGEEEKLKFNAVAPNKPPHNGHKQAEPEKPQRKVNQSEFFRNRATSEVQSLQMVEHVMAGVEREILNIAPKLYNDLPVKKALHDFLQVSGNSQSPEHAQSEFQLMQET